MRRLLIGIFAVLVAGCVAQPQFSGPPEFQSWMRRALAAPNDNAAYQRFSSAYHGDAAALHTYFAEALRRAKSSEIDAEGGEALSFQLKTIIRHLGDRPFASALRGEPLETRSAVATFLPLPGLSDYPETLRLLKSAPKIDFPLYRAYRGDTPKT
jgi:hypothetical protein